MLSLCAEGCVSSTAAGVGSIAMPAGDLNSILASFTYLGASPSCMPGAFTATPFLPLATWEAVLVVSIVLTLPVDLLSITVDLTKVSTPLATCVLES